jgi:predicted ferric reductase
MEFNESAIGIQTFLFVLIAMTVGTLVAVVVLPAWLPNMAQSLMGTDPKAYWYLSRGSAFAALGLLWISMALGLMITNKMARIWPGAPTTFAIHEYVSLLGLAFAIFHALVLLGDHYINYTLVQVIVPFASSGYKPTWVGLGQIGFYVWLIVALTFYVRQSIGPKTWRLIHYGSFAMFALAIYHGLTSGTDTQFAWAQYTYWALSGSLVFLLIHRIVISLAGRPASAPAPVSAPALKNSNSNV